ncbi:hypothetical protein CC53_gp068 [Rhizobium phage vB_RleS_L338C]|uniref:hypothetical protein n=1 Tax=Rhizobium phage vB_RleS_L338C TaxID=1414737 RepID=UPI0003D8E865|nr:hypothetical protein CC53_gp068 [Rhizobium phage vB_RleS_L338C]AHC30485.1 hypothetical protein L338C_068 [Rhizobium phage vB_RleS_L338C]
MSTGDLTVRTRNRVPPPEPQAAPRRAVNLHVEPELVIHEGSVQVSRVMYGVETESVNEKVAVPIFHTAPARVRISGGITKNLGDYNSARFDVSMELPCYPEDSEIDRTKSYISAKVEQYLLEEMEQAGVP